MLPFYRTPTMSGFCYKNLTLSAFENVLKYNLSTVYDLGLPKDSLIFGIGWRMPANSNDGQGISYSKRGVELVENAAMQSATINLKDSDTRDILSKQPVYPPYPTVNGEDVLGSNTIYFEPRLAHEIDFTRSTISFLVSPVKQGDETKDIEIMILYYDQSCAIEKEPSIMLNSGLELMPIRTKALDVIQQTDQREYALARSSTIGINAKSILVGIYFQFAGEVDIPEGPAANNLNYVFLTLKRRQNTFVDALPFQYVKATRSVPQSSYLHEYTPIQPTRIGEIDWEASQVKFADGKFAFANRTIRMVLAYIEDHSDYQD
jgi:hypothetical protein